MIGGRARRRIGVVRGARRLSLRARLLALTVVLLAAGLTAFAAIVLATLREPLVAGVDDDAHAMAEVMAVLGPQLVDVADGIARGDVVLPLQPIGDELTDELYLAFLDDGAVREVWQSVPDGAGPDFTRAGSELAPEPTGDAFGVPAKDGSAQWRAVALPRTAQNGDQYTGVLVAVSLSGVDDTIDSVRAACVAIGSVLLVVLGLCGRFAIGRGLRPLHDVEETSAAIAGGDLSRRVPVEAPANTEMGRLSAALNGMLGQIESAFAAREDSEARMRRFVADASHELRTPLAGIGGFAELYRLGGLPEGSDVERTMGRIEHEARRLTRLVDDLLLLARLDDGDGDGAGSLPMDLVPMDLRPVATDAVHDLFALDQSRDVRLTGPGGGPPAPAPVLGDEARLRQAVSNLLGNVIAHTPAGTPVRVGVGAAEGHAVLEIEDHGPGLDDEHLNRVFERFYRVDDSRGRDAGGGAGLGLAIVRSLITAHGGRVEVTSRRGEGTTVRLVLPMGRPSSSPAGAAGVR